MVKKHMGKNKRSALLKHIIILSLSIVLSGIIMIRGWVNLIFCHAILEVYEPIEHYYDGVNLVKLHLPSVSGRTMEISNADYEQNIANVKDDNSCECLSIFPNCIGDSKCEYFYYADDIEIFDSSIHRIELYVKIIFSDYNLYAKEIERISHIANKNKTKEIIYVPDLFFLPAYVTIYNYEGIYEYALVDSASTTIYYLYLQNVGEENYVFDGAFIPKKRLIDSSFPKSLVVVNKYNMYGEEKANG